MSSRALSSDTGITPSINQLPSARWVAQASICAPGCSSPVMASSMSIGVIRPCTTPYSSTTNTMRVERARNCSSSSMPVRVSGTNTAGTVCASMRSGLAIGSDAAVPERSASSVATLTTPTTSSRLPRATGYHECPVLPALAMACATVSEASSHSMSERGSIRDVSRRSSSKNTFCTIWCSCSSIRPASTPSSRLAAISSSVTDRPAALSMRSSVSTACVLMDSSRTKGLATSATPFMGREISRAVASGCSWAMRLGTSSPNTMVMKVMTVTTSAVAEISATRGDTDKLCSQADKPPLKAASPMMPLSMPIDVMPTCTDDKNWVGLPSKSSATCAPLSPDSAMAVSRALRLDASAISDMAKTPFNRVKNAIRTKSMGKTGRHETGQVSAQNTQHGTLHDW